MDKHEAWSKIIGNEHLKRVLEVTLAGGHTVTVIGHSDNGEKYLSELLGDKLTFLAPCPCGYLGDPVQVCSCTPGKVKKHRMKKAFQKAALNDIKTTLLTPHPSAFSRAHIAEPFSSVEKRISSLNGTSVEDAKDGASLSLFETACRRLRFTAGMAERVKAVARTIARLEHETIVKSHHLSEAIQYGIDSTP